jgi:hypothetical protein
MNAKQKKAKLEARKTLQKLRKEQLISIILVLWNLLAEKSEEKVKKS